MLCVCRRLDRCDRNVRGWLVPHPSTCLPSRLSRSADPGKAPYMSRSLARQEISPATRDSTDECAQQRVPTMPRMPTFAGGGVWKSYPGSGLHLTRNERWLSRPRRIGTRLTFAVTHPRRLRCLSRAVRGRTLRAPIAGVTQLVEYLPSKQAVASSSLVPRSTVAA